MKSSYLHRLGANMKSFKRAVLAASGGGDRTSFIAGRTKSAILGGRLPLSMDPSGYRKKSKQGGQLFVNPLGSSDQSSILLRMN
jgi:hypothetical protein